MSFGNFISKVGFLTKKHSPEILIAGSIVSAVASVGLAIYSTTKLEKTLEPFNKDIDRVKNSLKEETDEEYVKKAKKELTSLYGKAFLKVGTLYLPSALLLTSSIVCVLNSHKIMKGRNLALAAACTTLDQSYKAYRERVKKKFGEEIEDQIYKDVSTEEVEVTDPKTGKTVIKKVDVPHATDEVWNVIFDADNPYWSTNAAENYTFLMQQQSFLSSKLRRDGYLFLSDVYDSLGFTTSMLGPRKAKASHVLGWIYDPKNTKRNCYISFGLTHPGTNIALPKISEQIESNNPSFWLSLNPDGDILSGDYGKEDFTKFAKD